MEENNKTKKEEKDRFIDKFNLKQDHPLFRSLAESEKFVFNKQSLQQHEYPTYEQQTMPQSKPGFGKFFIS